MEGGKSEKHQYLSKHFTRVVLLAMEASKSECIRSLPFSELSRWVPDENNYADVVTTHWGEPVRCHEVEHAFNTSALMWHVFACFFGGCDTKSMPNQLNKMTDESVWAPLKDYEKERHLLRLQNKC